MKGVQKERLPCVSLPSAAQPASLAGLGPSTKPEVECQAPATWKNLLVKTAHRYEPIRVVKALLLHLPHRIGSYPRSSEKLRHQSRMKIRREETLRFSY